jgi:hypothetical protein
LPGTTLITKCIERQTLLDRNDLRAVQQKESKEEKKAREKARKKEKDANKVEAPKKGA